MKKMTKYVELTGGEIWVAYLIFSDKIYIMNENKQIFVTHMSAVRQIWDEEDDDICRD